MPNLTFTTAVRTWSQDRHAVEFPGQWEATRYRFFVHADVLATIGDLGRAVEADSALGAFDDHLGMLLPVADFLWAQSDKMQAEYVITTESLQQFRQRSAEPDKNEPTAEND